MDEFTKKYMEEKTKAIDEHFFIFLKEQGITESRKFEEIDEALKAKKLEVFNEVTRAKDGTETYLFRLQRVERIAETRISIAPPKIETENEKKN